MFNLPVGDFGTDQGIHNPQHARLTGTGSTNTPTLLVGEVNGTAQNVVMDIYTGTCVFTLDNEDLTSDVLTSLVPMGPPDGLGKIHIQGYPANVTAIISASMTNFGSNADAAWVDGASVKLVQHSFPGVPPRNVLVITADIGVEDGQLHRMAYQVTVLASVNADTTNQLGSLEVRLDPTQNVPDL
jgi:hypothetical protein